MIMVSWLRFFLNVQVELRYYWDVPFCNLTKKLFNPKAISFALSIIRGIHINYWFNSISSLLNIIFMFIKIICIKSVRDRVARYTWVHEWTPFINKWCSLMHSCILWNSYLGQTIQYFSYSVLTLYWHLILLLLDRLFFLSKFLFLLVTNLTISCYRWKEVKRDV